MKKNNNYLIYIFVFLCQIIFAQDIKEKNLSLVLQLGHQDELIPFRISSLEPTHKILVRPMISAGVQKTWHSGKRFRLYQDGLISYHINPYNDRSLGIGTDLGLEWRFFKKVIFNPKFGYHFNRASYHDPQYVYENNKWVATENSTPSNNRNNYKVGLDLGYGLNDKLDIVVGGYISLLTKYAPEISVNVYRGINVGVRYHL